MSFGKAQIGTYIACSVIVSFVSSRNGRSEFLRSITSKINIATCQYTLFPGCCIIHSRRKAVYTHVRLSSISHPLPPSLGALNWSLKREESMVISSHYGSTVKVECLLPLHLHHLPTDTPTLRASPVPV
jgi:hypothetical protein